MTWEPRRGLRTLVAVAAAVVVIAGLRAAGPLILPILVAGFLAILSLPVLGGLRRRGMPIALSVLTTVLVVAAVVGVFGLLVNAALGEARSALPVYLEQLRDQLLQVQESLQQSSLANYYSPERLDPAAVAETVNSLLGGVIRGTVVGVATVVSYVTLILLALVFMLAEACVFEEKVALASAYERRLDMSELRNIAHEVQHYLGIKTAVSLATGVIIFFWTWLAGLDFPLFWALLAFVLNYIPTLGSIIAGAPAVLLALVQQGVGLAGVVALGYLVTNMVLGNLLEPRLMAIRFRLSTLVVFLSLMFWGFIWGPLGMLLSVPLTRSLLIVLDHSGNFEWLVVLLGRRPRAAEVRESG